ncbi:MAG TPA: glycogen synthase GlgA [Nitrosospira sp.]|nr:glycogen synthase GlgA [Nitrosospira sp.]
MVAAGSHDSRLRVLFVTPEIHPLNKTGGLGDVSAALPAALRELHVDARVLIPGYPQVMSGLRHKRKIAEFDAQGPLLPCALFSAELPVSRSEELPLLVIDCPPYYQRDGGPYSDASGRSWPDNDVRFGLLSKIGAILASDSTPIDWHPHVAHCNDWQAGLLPAYLHFHPGKRAATLMTIHNLAFQGVFPPDTVTKLGLPASSFGVNGVEYYGGMAFLKAGLYYSDHISTVSPTYAREIQAAPLGFGMEGLLASRHNEISGILNGIDTDEWDPGNDPYLARHYSISNLAAKSVNKKELQQVLGLDVDPRFPLFGAVSRITYQKGCDLLLRIAKELIAIPAQLAVLGNGEAVLEREFSMLAKSNPGKIAVSIGFDEKLAHMIEAGADSFLMPSRFEPCGLNQMYSQRYGTPPLVHATGGLIDTVADFTPASLAAGKATGFLFQDMTPESFLAGIRRVVDAYNDKPDWQRLKINGMTKDFSWRSSATAYREIYSRLSSLSSLPL